MVSLWALMGSWLTPTSLFILLNLMIGTIVLTSRFHNKTQQHQSHDNPQQQPLVRAPSLLDRVKSITFSYYEFSPPVPEPGDANRVDPVQLERAPSLLERVKSINFSSLYKSESETEIEHGSGSDHASASDHHVTRSKSEPRGVGERRVEEKMKKSASERTVAAAEEEELVQVGKRRPEALRLEKTVSFGDEGVDAKADDFINKFKQQLKLQRLDSLLRCREILRGK